MTGTILTPDLCVLGGTASAGRAAAEAALLGLSTVLVRGAAAERAPPSRQVRALAAAAAALAGARRAAAFGLAVPEAAASFARVRHAALAQLADLARNESDARLRALGVNVIRADGRFMDSATLTAAGFEIRARLFLLAPAFVPVVPPVPGLARTAHLAADRLFEFRELPRHLAVIGAGATGLSLAQSFRRLGAEVTVLEAAAPLAGEDRECAGLLLDALAREGVHVRSGVDVRRVEGRRGALRLTVQEAGGERTVAASHLLLACGWRADTDALGLELAGIDAGSLAFGDPRTGNRRIFVAANGPGLPQADAWHARLVLAHLKARLPLRPAAAPVARATMTDPSLAHVGLGEDEARARHGRVRVLRRPFAENEAAVLARQEHGIAKLVAAPSGRLLGATVVGAGAADLIGPLALAVARRLPLAALAGPLFPHPARAEILQETALSGLGRGLTGSLLQRIIAALRLSG